MLAGFRVVLLWLRGVRMVVIDVADVGYTKKKRRSQGMTAIARLR